MAVIARVAYALLFCVALPLLLALWAHATDAVVELPTYGGPRLAAVLAATGAILFASGVVALWRRGGGLPMNAFPPPRLVSSGIYAIFPHPIYTGFILLCFAAAMASRSAAGLWLVAPVAAAGCVALVYGHEKPDLARRFGESVKSLRCLPPPTSDRPALRECLRFYLFVLVPWLALYEIVAALGVQRGSLDTRLPFESRLPVWTWSEAVYASTYLVALAAPLLTRTKRDLRTLTVRCWLAMATVFPVYLFLPTHAPFRPFEGGGVFAGMLRFERAVDMPAEALPSFHVIWAILAAAAMRSRIAAVWAVAASVACVMNGAHAIADVVAGGIWSLLLLHADRVWDALRSAAERLANSWREWRVGPFRLIVHGLYAGLGTFLCVAIVSSAVPSLTVVAFTAAAALLGAGMWAQFIEGSPRLLRPFGFYGGLFAVMLAACATPEPWLVMGAYSLAGPWLQALGRVRCLVQGCCHGRPADFRIGIRYTHPRSRVCRIAGLAGIPVHPTPLYSIFSNMVAALILARLWHVGTPVTMIGGLWLIVNGLARFVEEAYRGEPQTPILAGLRLYQWIAIATVIGGAVITAVPSAPAPALHLHRSGVALAFAFSVLSAAALGLDAPESSRRFGRLT